LPLIYERCRPAKAVNLAAGDEETYRRAGQAVETAYAYKNINVRFL
jgi:hypothetical protein